MRVVPTVTLVIWTFHSMLACKPTQPEGPASEAQGLAKVFGGELPVPQAKSPADLGQLGRSLRLAPSLRTPAAHPGVARTALQAVLVEEVMKLGGVPRWQLRHLLKGLVSSESKACDGQSCMRVFGLTEDKIEEYLDEILKKTQRVQPSSVEIAKRKGQAILLGSLRRDYTLPTVTKADQPIAFKHFKISGSVGPSSLGRRSALTQAEADDLTSLELILPRGSDELGPIRLDDLAAFRNLKSLTIVTDSPEIIREIARFGDTLRSLHIEPFGYGTSLKMEDMAILGSLPHLTEISITQPSLLGLEKATSAFSRVRSLTVIDPKSPITDRFLQAVGTMESLRHLGLKQVSYKEVQALKYELPAQISSVHYGAKRSANHVREKCGSLAALRIFRQTSTMQIDSCVLSGMGPFGGPVKWQILDIKDSLSESGARKNFIPTAELGQLMIFRSIDSPTIDLDERVKHELAVKLALAKKG